ncbi:MAG: LPD38 domain-containing protein, partial [Gallionella sp.]
SKVVDADGKPLVVYHGTDKGIITQFYEGGHFGDIEQANDRIESKFAPRNSMSDIFSGKRTDLVEGAVNYPVYIKIENPLYAKDVGDEQAWDRLMNRADADGHDGIIYRNDNEGAGRDSYLVWEPTQIKSAIGNNGSFSPTNPNILFSTAPKQKTIPGTAAPSAQPPRQGNIPLQGGQPGNNASWDAPEPTMLDNIIYKLQDKHIDLKRVTESIKSTGAALADKYNAYLQEELFHGRAAKRVADFVNTELKPIMFDMRQSFLTIDELDQYLHARHAKEANALIAERDPNMPDGGSGMTDKQADDYMAGLDKAKRKRLEATAKRVDSIIAKTRDLYVSYGLVSKDTADGWAQMFQHYVPLMREDHDGGMGIGQGFSIKGKEVKHRTGSTKSVVDIFANIALQREKAVARGEKNRVAVALAGLAKLNPNPDFWTFGKAPIERVLNEKTGLVEERVDPMFKSRANVVIAKIKDNTGQVHERAIVFNESNERAVRMAEAIKNLDASQLGGLLGVSAKVTRYFSSINTQYNPVFGITNLIRDVQGAALNLTSTPLAKHKAEVIGHILSAAKGIYLDARAERQGHPATSKWAQLWEELQDEGGMTGYRDLYRNSEDRAKAIEHELDPHNWTKSKWGKVFTANGALRVPLTKAQDMAGPIFDWLSDYNLMMEGSTRLSIYKVGIDHGLSKQEAASLAKNTTVNFNRKGQSGQQAGALYAFFNAAMQGTARMGQTLFDMKGGDIKTVRLSKTGKAIVAGGVSLGVIQALALAMAGFDDDEPPEFIRERNLVIPIGGKKYISIPMPLGFHILPNIGRISTEFAMNGFKHPADHVMRLANVFAEAFNPIGNAGLSLQTISPTPIDPLAALAENKDWTGKPIYKEDFNSMKPTPGFTRNKDTATIWSKLIAEGVNFASGGTEYTPGTFSPTADQIDYLIGQATGGVGRETGKVVQTVESVATGEALPTHKIPLVGRFYGDTENQSSQGNKYYANLKRLNLLDAEWDGLRKDHLPTDKFKRDNPEYRLIIRAQGADRNIQMLKKQKRKLIEKDATRAQVQRVEERITREMRKLNEAVSKASP